MVQGPGDLQDALKRVGGVYIPPTQSTPPMLGGRNVALFDIVVTLPGLDGFDPELENTIEVTIGRTKVKVLPLERIITSKKATNREKDRLVLPVLEDAAATLRERQRRK